MTRLRSIRQIRDQFKTPLKPKGDLVPVIVEVPLTETEKDLNVQYWTQAEISTKSVQSAGITCTLVELF